MSKGGGRDGTVISPQLADIRAKSFLHALSEIEQLSAVEYKTDLPEGVVPMLPKFSFWDIAGKTAMVTTFYTFLIAPFSFAVIDKILPVFGNPNPSFMDQLFAYLLAAAPTIAMTLLIILTITTRTYLGRTTRKIVESFLLTFGGVKVALSFLLTMIILSIYYKVLTDENIIKMYVKVASDKFLPLFVTKNAYSFFSWFLEFKEIIPKATKFAVFLHVGSGFLLLLSYLYIRVKTKKIEKFRQEWE